MNKPMYWDDESDQMKMQMVISRDKRIAELEAAMRDFIADAWRAHEAGRPINDIDVGRHIARQRALLD